MLIGEEAAAHTVAQTLRLVEDLLEHEMGEASLVEHVQIHVYLLDIHVNGFVL